MVAESDRQRLGERYMQVERKEIADRRNGELARVLGPALPGESQEELGRLAREDREKAEEGLAELRDGEEVWYKPVEELTRRDRAARIEAQRKRLEWVQGRLKSSSPKNPQR
ncbi:hypothetical protein [Rubrobacter aplysinae]|uniref:hypothetical protein n=1 Tax=Rubrobacter aplysinae TaxID=909625 RepID=UPI00128DEBA9|nr:hypothetical protein [Rubrobacter aplysinae]